MTALVSFYSRAGDCFDMKSAHLSQPIISTASTALAAETTTWAEEAVCSSVCMCVEARVEKEMRQWGCMRTGVAACKKNHWEHLQRHAEQVKRTKEMLVKHADSETTTTITQKRYQTFSCMGSGPHVEIG